MKVVYKYPLQFNDSVGFNLPHGATMTRVGMDNRGQPCIWILQDVNQTSITTRYFSIVGTGRRIHDSWKHVGSFKDDPFIWHVFEHLEGNS